MLYSISGFYGSSISIRSIRLNLDAFIYYSSDDTTGTVVREFNRSHVAIIYVCGHASIIEWSILCNNNMRKKTLINVSINIDFILLHYAYFGYYCVLTTLLLTLFLLIIDSNLQTT